MDNSEYQHPEWQKKRLEVMEIAQWKCRCCGRRDQQLNIHHVDYKHNRKIWEYDYDELVCLCQECHQDHHNIISYVRELLCQFHQEEMIHFAQMMYHLTLTRHNRRILTKKLLDTCTDFDPTENMNNPEDLT